MSEYELERICPHCGTVLRADEMHGPAICRNFLIAIVSQKESQLAAVTKERDDLRMIILAKTYMRSEQIEQYRKELAAIRGMEPAPECTCKDWTVSPEPWINPNCPKHGPLYHAGSSGGSGKSEG